MTSGYRRETREERETIDKRGKGGGDGEMEVEEFDVSDYDWPNSSCTSVNKVQQSLIHSKKAFEFCYQRWEKEEWFLFSSWAIPIES